MDIITRYDFPAFALREGVESDTFERVVGGAVREAMQDLLSDVQEATPYATIREGWHLEESTGGGHLNYAVANDVEHAPFREFDTTPHWAPWGPGTPLAEWAEAHDIPAFLVARKIAREGTKGNYIVTEAWERYSRDVLPKVTMEALYAYVLEGGR